MPMSFNIACIISPLLGGFLADLAGAYPDRFGHVGFLKRFPYAPPALLNGCFLGLAILLVFFGLEEVLSNISLLSTLGLI